MVKLGPKIRLDLHLVSLNLLPSRQRATQAIRNGWVKVDGCVINKPSYQVSIDNLIEITQIDPYVSRGAHKLLGALKLSGISLQNKVCLDIGASTGGFTQVCLEHGAKQIFAVDVGSNQLHPSLRQNPKVVTLEQINIKYLLLAEQVDFICVDVSFISLTKIIPHLANHLKPGGEVLMLVKPQFEVGRDHLPTNNIVKDPALHRLSLNRVKAMAQEFNFQVLGQYDSPILGKEGNQEFFLHLSY